MHGGEGGGGLNSNILIFFSLSCVIASGPLSLSDNDMCGVIPSDRRQWLP